ncbi:MAG: DUF2442 domain-containing protein [Chitinivibrionales bacterium]|nr:DUF2442 domain-containing protein [Chitinivibrionales bacterium]
MEQVPRIRSVKPLPNKHLEIEFENGEHKDYDCNPILKRPEFFLLKDDGFFKCARVDSGGYGISWNDDIDISEYEAWTQGVEMVSQ